MAKQAINTSQPLRQAVDDMAQLANAALVGLVIRFNESDNSIRTLWSEGPSAPQHPDNPDALDRAQVTRNVNDANPASARRIANRVSDIAGYHAEELLILTCAALLRAASLEDSELRSVDIVLSKSPCHGASASSKMRVIRTPEEYEIGCSTKLAQFIGAKPPTIQWRIAFLALAGSDANDYSPIGGTGIARIMHTRERDIAHASRLQAEFLSGRAIELRRDAAWQSVSAEILQRAAQQTTGPDRGALIRGSQSANRRSTQISQQLRQATQQHFRDARTQSIAQAQHGITILDRHINIDVRRWV